ncbi:hypothetical protein F442_02974 [Phytophthora nicotianae P10297]|uniref:Uncharacterized protein n=2 Tax=Phytophthora nicotianae TaxID=4792 RepID=W2ZY61_PHYNI|nr:hypothetical protein F442_02974 [Phytophthora nicotianae P10297]
MGLVLWGVSPFEGKGTAATWFLKLEGQTPLKLKRITNLEWHLRNIYGRESACGIKDWTSKTTGEFYVDAFARGMKTKISAQVVRPAKPPTLKQGVGFAIENSSKYGEGAR